MAKKFTVVVADRAQACVYQTARIGGALERVATLGNPNARMHERELRTYAPGRAFNRNSGMHQTLSAQHTQKQHDAEQFARVVSKTVELSCKSPQCGGVVLVAGPRMLSAIRKSLPKDARTKVLRTIPKDLIHQPKSVINDHLRVA